MQVVTLKNKFLFLSFLTTPRFIGGVLFFMGLVFNNFVIANEVNANYTILAVGDSLTAGYGLDATNGFTKQLERRLNDATARPVTVINAGVSGDTSRGGLERIDWLLSPTPRPDLVMLALGANDALRGLSPAVTQENLDQTLAKIQASGADVLLIGMLAPPNMGTRYRQEFDAIYPTLAARYSIPLYPFFLDKVAGFPALNQADGIHPNAEGVAVMVNGLTPCLLSLMQQISVQCAQ